MRAHYRFAEWTLTAGADCSVRYVGTCLDCGEFCVDTASADAAQGWCLRHAGLTGDKRFEMRAFQYFSADMTDPLANASPPT
ncbi:hypothetical protein B1H19_01275 [Streptomyces gilvosporeus]|uniref:DUF7848 domain-containing protein n=1 Tax=Streptomyces gilvosporeus TaxID=553510 RepID=A0A1V0TJA2_9ACTN|nr:hypothetical protein B1H19_01275 [Streptomyces gilvosporeus]